MRISIDVATYIPVLVDVVEAEEEYWLEHFVLRSVGSGEELATTEEVTPAFSEWSYSERINKRYVGS